MSVSSRSMRWVGIGLVVLGATLLVVWGVGLLRTLNSLQARVDEVQALMKANPREAEPEALGALIRGAREDVVALERNAGWLAPLGPAFRWLPRVGPLLGQAQELLSLADGLTEAGVLLWDDVAPAAPAFQQGQPATAVLVDVLPQLAADAPQARAAAVRAQTAYAEIDIATLPYRLQAPLTKLGTVLPFLDDGLALAAVAPELWGLDGPRTYLVLALNEDELRPGGGYITGVGEVRVEAGKVVSMTFRDSYAVDDFSLPYPDPPDPLRQFMNVDLWVFRDSNWSPDFPTSARQAIALYRPGYAVTVSGVIAVDQRAVQHLIDALGPLSLPDSAEPLTGATVIAYIHSAWAPEGGELNREWWKQRKSFMGPLAVAALQRIEGGAVDWSVLGQTMVELLRERHLLVYVDTPEAAAVLRELGWDGGLRASDGDYLMVVEANVGFNKASPKIARAFTYEVDLTQSPPQATLTLAYTHTSQVEIACKPEARYDPEYVQMMDRCYWGYLRVYAPEGAVLREASQHPIPADAVSGGRAWEGRAPMEPAPEGGWTVMAQAVLIPTASQTQVRLTYDLPERVLQQGADGGLTYRLLWQKQPGLGPVPVRVILRMPRNAVLCSMQPRSTLDDDGVLLYDVDLDADLNLVVSCRLSEEEER